MGSVRRIYVEKKQPYAVHAKELKEEVKRYLGIKSINNVSKDTKCSFGCAGNCA